MFVLIYVNHGHDVNFVLCIICIYMYVESLALYIWRTCTDYTV